MPKMRVEEVNACSEVRPVSKPIVQWTLIAAIREGRNCES